jgi:4-oxalocrotonate tautomerase
MPHVYPGKSEQHKKRLADALTKEVMEILHYGEKSVSVALQQVAAQDWADKGVQT